MNRELRELVRNRAGMRCEYCQLHQRHRKATHEIDHVIAEKHDGRTIPENLALSCIHCNSFKGPCVAGVDPGSGVVTRLFHPRVDHWHQHFYWDGPLLMGKTDIGRATVAVLEINEPEQIELREGLIELGEFPPEDD